MGTSRSRISCLLLTSSFLATTATADTLQPAFEWCPPDRHCRFPNWEPAGSLSHDRVGQSLDVFGDVAAVGATSGDHVYMYVRYDGNWQPADVLTAPPGHDPQRFGYDVKIGPGFLFVASPLDDVQADNAGVVFYYERQPDDTWTLVHTLYESTPEEDAYFGSALGCSEGILAVGASGATGGGAVHLFDMSGPGPFVEYDTIQEPTAENLGESLDLENGFLVVGDSANDAMGDYAGAVYTYEVSLMGHSPAWMTVAGDGAPYDGFGWRLDLDGDTVVVGSNGDDDDGSFSGSVYVFQVVGSMLHPVTKILACDADEGDSFGFGLALSGRFLLVGAPDAEPAGKAYVYRREPFSDPPWIIHTTLIPDDAIVGGQFGYTVALDGNYPLVGAPGTDGAAPESGAVYRYSLGNDDLLGADCPCDVQATDVEYGVGKAGTLGVPRLQGRLPSVIGETTGILLSKAQPGSSAFLLVGFDRAAVPFDGGKLLVAAPKLVVLPVVPAAGVIQIDYDLGLDPTLCGLKHTMQALVIDPGAAGPLHTAQSNAIERVYGW